MKTVTRPLLRATALAAAALFLPCCRDEVGKGDQLSQVTVRASITLGKVEPNQPCVKPCMSDDGNLIAFESLAGNLSPNDSNGFRDIFVRDRLTGAIENATRRVPTGNFPPWFPGNCTDPAISGNGRYIAFCSNGNYAKLIHPSGGSPHVYIWVLDRQTGFFERGYDSTGGLHPNADMTDPTLSYDGRFLAFRSAATNFTPANPGAMPQIYITDLDAQTTTLVSRRFVSATPTTGFCHPPKISGDGQFVTFATEATDLVNPAPPATSHVYLGNAAGTVVELVSLDQADAPATNFCFNPVVSHDGRYVAFMTHANIFPAASDPHLVRRDRTAGTTELVIDSLSIFGFFMPDGLPFAMSADGQTFACVARSQPPPLVLNGFIQVVTRTMGGNAQVSSVHLNGSQAVEDCAEPALSGDGRWVSWSSTAPNLVDGDSNGVQDIFTRGPLK